MFLEAKDISGNLLLISDEISYLANQSTNDDVIHDLRKIVHELLDLGTALVDSDDDNEIEKVPLEPCPFCGGVTQHDEDCFIFLLEQGYNFESDYDFYRAWNRRTPQTCVNVISELPSEYSDVEGAFSCSKCGFTIIDHDEFELLA